MFDALYIAATGNACPPVAGGCHRPQRRQSQHGGFPPQCRVVFRSDCGGSLLRQAIRCCRRPVLQRTPNASGYLRGAGALARASLSTSGGELKQTKQPLNVAIDGVDFSRSSARMAHRATRVPGELPRNADGLLALADDGPRSRATSRSRRMLAISRSRVTVRSQ